MRYFLSDLHFGHRNVIRYCNRPFKDIDEMTKGLIKNWNDTITNEDTVYCLGDFSLNPKWSKIITPTLNGKKYLIPGNHDSCFLWKGREERNKNQIEKYINDGWLEIHQTLEIELKDGRKVLLSHLPYDNKEGSEYDARYMDYRLRDKGMYLLHGHLHCRYLKKGRMLDVGVDHDFLPITEDVIIERINDTRDFISSRITEYYKTFSKQNNIEGI